MTKRQGKRYEGRSEGNFEKTQYCHFWNNRGSCNFEQKNGRPCRFEHKTAPRCSFDGQCDRNKCMFTHHNQNMSFLANAQMRYQPDQWGQMRGPNPRNFQFSNQNQWDNRGRGWGKARNY